MPFNITAFMTTVTAAIVQQPFYHHNNVMYVIPSRHNVGATKLEYVTKHCDKIVCRDKQFRRKPTHYNHSRQRAYAY